MPRQRQERSQRQRAWREGHRADHGAAAKAVPRFREIFPQQANDITPFYKAHMAGSGKQGISNDVKSLHDSPSELDKIPDVHAIGTKSEKDSSRFAENMVQKIDLSKVAENSKARLPWKKSKACELCFKA